MAHPAGGHDDPLTTSLDEQFACSAPAPLAPRRREGWETEPIRVRHCWWFYALCFFAAMLLGGCSSTLPREASPRVWASCPPLTPPPKRNDADAQARRIAELEGWYHACREAALEPMPPRVRVAP